MALEIDFVLELVFVHAALDQRQRKGGAVDGDVDFGEEEGNGTDVVFVAVSEKESADVLAVLNEVGEIGGDEIDAEEFGFGKHHSGIDYDDVVAVAHRHHIHAKLADTAERNYL